MDGDSTLEIDRERLRSDVEATGEFGTTAGGPPGDGPPWGRTVLAGTEANRRVRDYLVDRLKDAGLDVTVDAVGNVAGTWTPPSADPDAAPVAAGSHLDSVPDGGIFDGPLGVYAALESVRALREAGAEPERPVVVVSFTEEEGGRFADGLLGSSVAAGERDAEAALSLTGGEGTTLADALAEIGYRGEGRLDAGAWDAWFELHVEQDTRLEDAREDPTAPCPVGAVTTITGITHCEATVIGEANHAGATPMGERADALAAASEFVLDVEAAAEDLVETESETAVATVGSLAVDPNATNVVPGRVEVGVDVRDVERESVGTLVEAARRSLGLLERERDVETAFERVLDVPPAPMSDRLRAAIRRAGDRAGIETIDLHSGAAHDSMHVAGVTDAAMLFAPSRDGISHNPEEWTDWEDCATATRALAGAIAEAAGVDVETETRTED